MYNCRFVIKCRNQGLLFIFFPAVTNYASTEASSLHTHQWSLEEVDQTILGTSYIMLMSAANDSTV